MKCPICGFESSNDSKFCCGCGRPFPCCPTCGNVITTRDRFCIHDGTRLPDELLMLVPETDQNDDDFEQVDVQNAAGTVVQQALRDEIEMPANPDFVASCLRCGSPVWQGGDYCVSCQNAMQTADPVCASCGMPCEPGEEYCSYCRPVSSVPVVNMDSVSYETYDTPKSPKKKRSGSVFTAILVVLLLLLIGAAAVLVASEFDLIELPDFFSSDDSGRDRDSDDENADNDNADDDAGTPDDGDNAKNPAGNGGSNGTTDTSPSETTAPTTAPTTAATEPTTQPTQPAQTKLEYFMENCDSMYFERSDIVGFTKEECYYARNACYAQGGRKFKNKELQAYFEQYYWYSPTYEPSYFDENDDELMNKYEKANRKLISEYEKEMGYK